VTDPTDTTQAPAKRPVDLEEIRRQREAAEALARAEEEEVSGGGPPGGGGGGSGLVDSPTVRACLHGNVAGDSEIYARLHQGKYLFCASMNQWLRWNGHHLEVDVMRESLAAVEDVAQAYEAEANAVQGEISAADTDAAKLSLTKLRDALRARASQLRSRTRRTDCLDFAATLQRHRMAIRGDELDQQPMRLPCANGVIHLDTGELHPGRLEDYLLRASPTEWHGIDAPCPTWDRVLHEIQEGRRDMVDFLARCIGCAIVGKTTEQNLFVLSGAGRNGKGIIANTICAVAGEVATVVRSEMLLDPGFTRSSAGPSPDIMALRGRRIVFASENDEHAKMSTSRVKWLTGGDEITARNPFDKFDVTFRPTHNLFLLTNHKPHAPADDFAFWERVLLIPFNLSYVMRDPSAPNERRADPRLPEKLLREAPGILAWMVRGCLQWQERGLDPPPAVRAAVAKYRHEEDIIGDFVDECLVLLPEDQVGVPARDVYDVFAWWWGRNVTKNPPKQKWLGNLLGKRFRREKVGTYRYYGFVINQDILLEMESGQRSLS